MGNRKLGGRRVEAALMIEAERRFINQFILRNRRKRLSFELWGRHRRQGLSRFCHHAEGLLIESKIVMSGSGISHNDLKGLLPLSCKDKECYIMAYHEPIDGIACGYDEALTLVLGNGMAAVIMFDGFAVVETEQCVGSAEKFVLRL